MTLSAVLPTPKNVLIMRRDEVEDNLNVLIKTFEIFCEKGKIHIKTEE